MFSQLFCLRVPGLILLWKFKDMDSLVTQICTTTWDDTSWPSMLSLGAQCACTWWSCTPQQCGAWLAPVVPSAAWSLCHPGQDRSSCWKGTSLQSTACAKECVHMGKLISVSLLFCCVLQRCCWWSSTCHWQYLCMHQLKLCLPSLAFRALLCPVSGCFGIGSETVFSVAYVLWFLLHTFCGL